MNPPPLPQPYAQTCPNCGAPVDGSQALCPRCGASLRVAQSQGAGCFIIGAQIFLGCLSAVLGLAGACFALFGVSFTSGNSGGEGVGMIMVGVVGILLAVGCVWGIIKLSKR